MQRRDFSLNALGALGSALSLAAALPTTAQAQAKKFDEGTDYIALDKPVPTEVPAGKVEVIEFFWYSCPHCNAFEPQLEAWLKRLPPDVGFRRIPVAFRDSFVPQQRLYYALEAMGKAEAMQRKVFTAIHVEKQALDTQETIVAWVEKQGLDKAKFLELYNSFSVSTKARKGTQLQNTFKIDGVPSLGIAGRFYTDATLARTMERALQVTDFLIIEARKLK
jgi:thiol:disulfide interchange protein DsbA